MSPRQTSSHLSALKSPCASNVFYYRPPCLQRPYTNWCNLTLGGINLGTRANSTPKIEQQLLHPLQPHNHQAHRRPHLKALSPFQHQAPIRHLKTSLGHHLHPSKSCCDTHRFLLLLPYHSNLSCQPPSLFQISVASQVTWSSQLSSSRSSAPS